MASFAKSVLSAAIVLVAVFSIPVPALAGVLQVQFQEHDTSDDQAGWLQVVSGDPPAATTVSGGEFDGVGISAGGTHVRSHTHDDQYAQVNHSDGDLDHLLSGGVLSNDAGSNVILTLTGLADGDYSITTYHHTPYSRTDGVTLDVRLTDAATTNSVIHDDVSISFGSSVTSAELAQVVTPFTVSGGSTTTLTFDPESAGFDAGGADHLNINGFELVPEPAGLLLAVMGALGLFYFSGRRRRPDCR